LYQFEADGGVGPVDSGAGEEAGEQAAFEVVPGRHVSMTAVVFPTPRKPVIGSVGMDME